MSESNKNSPEDRQQQQSSSVCDSSTSSKTKQDDKHNTCNLVSEVTKCDDGVEGPDGKKVAVATPYPGRKEVSLLSEESEEFKELKIDLTQTKKDRTREEVEKLVQWAVMRKNAISVTGELDFRKEQVAHGHVFELVLTTNTPYFKARPDKSSPAQKKETFRQVEEKLAQGIIEPSSAPWSSNCVLINRNGKVRIAVDYRKLNNMTVRDNYMLPRVQEILDCAANKKWFTSVDCVQAYHQIEILSERDKDLTTFVVPGGGLYRYKRMPFGLKNAGACWSRFIDTALGDLKWNVCAVYADDILICTESESVEDHIRDLNLVFDKLDTFGIKVRGEKIKLGVKELPFLGQIIGVNGCRPDPEKVKAITDMKEPSNVHELRRFLGMASYYRKFIKNFADITAPLYELAKKFSQIKRNSTRGLVLDEKAKDSFRGLKRILTEEPIVLKFPEWDKPFEVHCDASDYGLGAVLVQKVKEEERVVMYASRLMGKDERKYQSYEKEALAMVWSVELFSHYVKGGEFRVVTDCRALIFLKNNSTNSRIARWIMRLQEFDFQITHRPGKLALVADTMSRQPNQSVNPYSEKEVEGLYESTKPFGSIFEDVQLEKNKSDIDETQEESGGDDQSDSIKTLRRSNRFKTGDSGDVHKEIENQTENQSKRKKLVVELDQVEEKQKVAEEKQIDRTDESVESLCPEEKEGFFGKCEDKESFKIEEWIEEQKSEESILELRMLLENGHIVRKNLEGLMVKVIKVKTRKSGREEEAEKTFEVAFVPKTLRLFILKMHHNIQIHGHQGVTKLINQIKSRYYWQGMRRDATRYVNACLKCQKRKSVRNMQAGLIDVVQAQYPWETVGIDLVGKCVVSGKGNCWILTVVDHFTRYPIMIALPDRKTETIARVLFEKVFCVYGAPKKILSDRGKELIAESIEQIYDKWGIKLATTGGYNPQANGACERFHRWLHAAMTCVYDRKTLDWDSYLEPLAFAYRTSVNDSTGYSPFYLMHGREAVLPLDAMLNLKTQDSLGGDYVEELSKKIKKAFDVTRQQQYAAYVENYERIQNRQKQNYEKGDLVLVYKKSEKESRLEIAGVKKALPSKWKYRWVGPGIFEKEISNTEAQISLKEKSIFVSYNRLKKFKPWSSVKIWTDNNTIEEAEENEIFDISDEDEEEDPKVGDIIVFLMSSDDYQNANFGVGKIMEIRDDPEDLYRVHWYGNKNYKRDGVFLPGYVDVKDKRWFYEKENKARKNLYDSVYTNSKFNTGMVVAHGNLLDSKGFLKKKILKRMEEFRRDMELEAE